SLHVVGRQRRRQQAGCKADVRSGDQEQRTRKSCHVPPFGEGISNLKQFSVGISAAARRRVPGRFGRTTRRITRRTPARQTPSFETGTQRGEFRNTAQSNDRPAGVRRPKQPVQQRGQFGRSLNVTAERAILSIIKVGGGGTSISERAALLRDGSTLNR